MPYIGKQPTKIPLTSDDIADGAISSADIADLDAAKLTGTVNNARISLDAAEIPNLDTAKVTSGTFHVDRISEASVTQHVTATDLTPVKNDISLLALQTAINGNLSAYGLTNSWIEQFEDSTKITGLNNCARVTAGEYMASAYDPSIVTIPASVSDWNGATSNFTYGSGSIADIAADKAVYSDWVSGTGDFTVQFTNTGWTNANCGVFPVSQVATNWDENSATGGCTNMGSSYFLKASNNSHYYSGSAQVTYSFAAGSVIKITRVSGALDVFDDGVNVTSTAWSAADSTSMHFFLGTDATTLNLTSLTLTVDAAYVDNATGDFTSTAIAPQDGASKSSVGLIILYKDNVGTTTFNGANKLVGKVRANTSDSSYNEVVLASAGTYSDGMKIAVAPAISVTAGTDLSYKIEFAGQAVSSMETHVYGVAMTY